MVTCMIWKPFSEGREFTVNSLAMILFMRNPKKAAINAAQPAFIISPHRIGIFGRNHLDHATCRSQRCDPTRTGEMADAGMIC